jgi:tetratricopeptide (TPR) repeat protein
MGLIFMLSSCTWHEAKGVIAVADSLDQTEHVIYDDTAALGRTIRSLDNPFGRLFQRNTLGKAYYYMGRNLEDYHQQVAEAAGCYIEADRLQIDDPIYRGRVNSCMGYICAQNNNDSLALVFYERASEDFEKSGNEWRYAQGLLNIILYSIGSQIFTKADSLLQIAQSYQLDSAYQARYYETRGLYFYEQQQYDSALVYFERGLEYWPNEENRCFCYLKIMQAYYSSEKDIDAALHYAKLIVEISTNPNYLSNAYYCLMQDAKNKGDAELLSKYSHARTDTQKLLRDGMIKDAAALPILEEYLQNPHPWRWVWISFPIIIVLCLLLTIGIWIYRKHSNSAHEQLDVLSAHIRTQEEDLLYQQSLLEFEQNRLNILEKYHTPHKRWRKYLLLKRDIDPWMHKWLQVLDSLSLSDQEKIFCAISLIYPHMTDVEIADFICYSKGGIRVFKNRIVKKLGVASLDFADFLRNLSISR